MKHRTIWVLLLAFALGCTSMESAAKSGSDMASKNLGHTSTATKSATIDENKEVGDMEKAAEEGAEEAAD